MQGRPGLRAACLRPRHPGPSTPIDTAGCARFSDDSKRFCSARQSEQLMVGNATLVWCHRTRRERMTSSCERRIIPSNSQRSSLVVGSLSTVQTGKPLCEQFCDPSPAQHQPRRSRLAVQTRPCSQGQSFRNFLARNSGSLLGFPTVWRWAQFLLPRQLRAVPAARSRVLQPSPRLGTFGRSASSRQQQ